MDSPTTFLAQLAPLHGAAWQTLGADVFRGHALVLTKNSLYRFKDGLFVSRTKGAHRALESPPAMRGTRLIGFLVLEGSTWSLVPRWQAGAHAVMWRPGAAPSLIDPTSFIVTSETHSFALDRGGTPHASRHSATSESGVRKAGPLRTPRIMKPDPASVTRVHLAKRPPVNP